MVVESIWRRRPSKIPHQATYDVVATPIRTKTSDTIWCWRVALAAVSDASSVSFERQRAVDTFLFGAEFPSQVRTRPVRAVPVRGICGQTNKWDSTQLETR
eukprot:scaffold34499_cov73-Skeletonema_marinoi.AAC.1